MQVLLKQILEEDLKYIIVIFYLQDISLFTLGIQMNFGITFQLKKQFYSLKKEKLNKQLRIENMPNWNQILLMI